jgi:hypothetical protein
MENYDSIPFKNKDIDRFTGNTTIVPGGQFKEMSPRPINEGNMERNAKNAEKNAIRYAMDQDRSEMKEVNSEMKAERKQNKKARKYMEQ